MRTLAKYKLNLETIDDKLPNHTLEQVCKNSVKYFIFYYVSMNFILGFRCTRNNEEFRLIYF